ncbi:Gfo/Idh/MocA family protein [Geodermatophilus sp. SYSU D00708]
MTGHPLRFGVIGHGWRADFYLRLARRLPDRFACAGIVTRTPEVGERLTREWGVPTYRSPEALVTAAAPEVVVTSVPREANPDVIRALVDLEVAVLSETPPAADVEGMRRLWADVGGRDLVQVAEQHPYLPAVAALRALVETGTLGELTSAQVSWTHDYHAMGLLRFLLGVGFEPARVSGVHATGPVMEGPDRGGWPAAPEVRDTRHTLGIVEVGGRTAVYDFTDGQWFNPLRRRQVVLRGSLGEVVGPDVTWCGEPGTTLSAPIVRRQSGADGDLEGTDLETLSWAGRVLYRNRYRGARLSDEEIAIATSLEMTGAWRRGEGRPPYPLAEACQDHLLSLAVHHAAESGAPVTTRLEPWAAGYGAEPVPAASAADTTGGGG